MGYFEEAFGGGTSQSFGGTSDNFSSGGGVSGVGSDENEQYVDTSSLAGLLSASAGQSQQAQQAEQQIQSAINAQQAMEALNAPPPMMQDPYEMENLAAQQRFSELANRMTNVNFRSANAPISSLNQLAMRAGEAPRPSGQGLFDDLPSFLGKAVNALGEFATGSMYNDITQRGYIPQYDAAGQIVATINPATGQYGRGSVESRIDFTNPDTAEERRRLEEVGVRTPSIPVFDDDSPSIMGEVAGTGAGIAQPVTQDISMIPVGQIAAGGTPMYRRTLLDIAPTEYGGLLAGQRPSDFDVMNQAFRMTGATYPEYFQDPYNLTGYSILS